jgi:hypothetical protein
MTQPPDEPPPEQGWQPPGPPPPRQPGPPYGQIPYGQNPYGGGTTSPYQPVESGGMSSALKVVLGVLIGVFAGFFLWIVAAFGFAAGGTGDDTSVLFFSAVAPLVVPAPLLIWKVTRPWAAGLLLGTAVASIGMASLCSALINSYNGGAQ